MGHQIEYYSTKVTTEKNLKLFISRITGNAYDPRESGGYHGNLTIHRNEIYKNYEEAVEAIKKYDSGWYSDHIVMYYDISAKGRAKTKVFKEAHESEWMETTDAYDLLTVNTATSGEYFAEMYAYFRINGIVSDDTCPMTKEVFRKLFNE